MHRIDLVSKTKLSAFSMTLLSVRAMALAGFVAGFSLLAFHCSLPTAVGAPT